MFLVSQTDVDRYLTNDVVSGWLDVTSSPGDEDLVCHRWLRQNPSKRFIFHQLYGELLTSAPVQKVLDVGGGLTALTRTFATKHKYVLADLLAHDDVKSVERMNKDVGWEFIKPMDWATLEAETYDLVIANDIFPNVDQRLDIFLQTFLPITRRIRVSLTYYDSPRFYMTRRLDADEILCMLAWNGTHLCSVLNKYSKQIVEADFEIFSHPNVSVFPNGRQVCLVELHGGLEAAAA